MNERPYTYSVVGSSFDGAWTVGEYDTLAEADAVARREAGVLRDPDMPCTFTVFGGIDDQIARYFGPRD